MVAIVGRPNVGKSTLLNTLLGQKTVITSSRPQTTRNRITCILTQDSYQIVFMDTPGLHRPKDELHQFMMKEISQALSGVDVAVAVMDTESGIGPGDWFLLNRLKAEKIPTIVLCNKIDILKQDQVIVALDSMNRDTFWHSLFAISAATGDGVEAFLKELVTLLPEGPPLYPEEMITDRSERFVVSEMIREQVFRQTRQEIPHATAVKIESFQEREDGLIEIEAVIVVEQESQKGIMVGKGGSRLREIGTMARKEIEELLAAKVMLKLQVKMEKNWRKNHKYLEDLGYPK
jgi:GTPase